MEEDSPLIQAEDGCRPPKLQQDWQIFLALFKAFVGSGLLGLPYAFRLSGVVLASLAVLFVSLFAFYACLQLVRVKDYWGQVLINPQLSYGDLAGKSLGRYGSHLVNAALLITQCGFCVAYLIFMGNTLHSLVSELTVLQWTSVCLVAVMALSVLNYRLLSPLTLVASVAYVFGIVALGVLFMGNRREEDAVVADPRYLAYAISLATYSFEGVGVIAPLHSEAKNPHHFTYLLALTILIVAVITVCFGDLGYLALGNDILPIVTESVPSSSVLLAVRIALVFSLYITYPVQVYPVFEILENEYLGLVEDGRMAEFLLQRTQHVNRILFGLRWAVRFGVCLLTYCVAILVPNFGIVLGLIGATGSSFLVFIAPPLMFLRTYYHNGNTFIYDRVYGKVAYVLNVLLIVFGALASMGGIYVCATIE